jgi:hypothetical protein
MVVGQKTKDPILNCQRQKMLIELAYTEQNHY